MTIQMKATEQYLPAVLFIMLHKMLNSNIILISLEFVDEISKCDGCNINATKT